MEKCTAFVLSGGGSRGALQVGALRALLEAGIIPDLLVGSSIGAVNAAGLALWGADLNGVQTLENIWAEKSSEPLLDPRFKQLVACLMRGRVSSQTKEKIEAMFVSLGISRDLRFSMIAGVRLALVSADIRNGQPVIYGLDPDDSVMEGLLASIALPPWFTPIHKNGQVLIDGGVLCNLPIEPALRMGTTEIYALDVDDAPQWSDENPSFFQYYEKYISALNRRHVFLEMTLADAQGIPVHLIEFRGHAKNPLWDFKDYHRLHRIGYEETQKYLAKMSGKTDSESHLSDRQVEMEESFK